MSRVGRGGCSRRLRVVCAVQQPARLRARRLRHPLLLPQRLPLRRLKRSSASTASVAITRRLRTGGLALDRLDAANPGEHAQVWEAVVEKLRAGSMPPPGRPRPDQATYLAAATELERALDRAWAANPDPGRIGAVHRLNRTEYGNAIRDLFGLDPQSIDVASQLPGDETADGSFDKFADVLSISTAHLERYMSVARQVTRLATALPPPHPAIDTFEIPLHVTQDDRQSEDLPLGSRGGISVRHHFPVDGEYRFKVRLQRNYQDYLKGMGWEQLLDVRIDGALLKRFTVGGKAQGRAAGASYAGDGEPGYRRGSRVGKVHAGRRRCRPRGERAGAPPDRTSSACRSSASCGNPKGCRSRCSADASSPTTKSTWATRTWRRFKSADRMALRFSRTGTRREPKAESRERLFVCRPRARVRRDACATKILSRIARLAYRRPVNAADVQTLMTFYDDGRRDGGSFEVGVQFALERMLVDPDFLLRVYRDPKPSSTSSLQLTQLSAPISCQISSSPRVCHSFSGRAFPTISFSTLAEQRKLAIPTMLEQQVKRMLADPRASDALVDDFAAQWLNLRRVAEVVVDPERYPNYDLTLMDAFKRETELFVGSTLREDRSVLELLNADYTFVNEKLARHYGIPGVYGSRFRRVTLPDTNQRGGLLAQGALLSTTSYPDRTSPVLRGKFLLNNIFGLQTTPPPAGVDTNLAPPKPGAAPPTIRERLERASHQSDRARAVTP